MDTAKITFKEERRLNLPTNQWKWAIY